MEFDFERLEASNRYKIMTSTIVPRPIAWVTTLSKDGVGNAAPFSFFNALGRSPPLVALGILGDEDASMKDTARNILDTGEFVANLVPASATSAMSATSASVPPDIDELTLAGLERAPSVKVKPPRIAVSPVSFECRLHTPLQLGPDELIVLGEIVQAHVADSFMLDPARYYIDTPALELVGRMHGRGWYAKTSDLFQLNRPAKA